jgi:hypothetical protein
MSTLMTRLGFINDADPEDPTMRRVWLDLKNGIARNAHAFRAIQSVHAEGESVDALDQNLTQEGGNIHDFIRAHRMRHGVGVPADVVLHRL